MQSYFAFKKIFLLTFVLLFLAGNVPTINAEVEGEIPTPKITSMGPASVMVGSPGFNLVINGAGFIPSSQVSFNGQIKQTIFTSSTILQATISATDLTVAGPATVGVRNPEPGGAATAVFIITQAPNPIITNITPDTTQQGIAVATLTVTGTGFMLGSTIQFGNATLTPTVVTDTRLITSIPAANVQSVGQINVSVINSNQATSNTVKFTVTAQNTGRLVINKVSTGGSGLFTFSLFPTPSIMNITTAANGTGQSSLVLAPGNYSVSELNQIGWAFMGATCEKAAFTPSANGLASVTITAGRDTVCTFTNKLTAGAITVNKITIGGNGTFNFTAAGTTYIPLSITTNNGSGSITKIGVPAGVYTVSEAIPVGWIKSQDTCGNIIVTEGQTTTCTITNTRNAALFNIIALNPFSTSQGNAVPNLAISGVGFTPGTVVNFGNIVLSPTSITPTQLLVNVPAAQTQTPGQISVRVTKTNGDISNNLIFTVLPVANTGTLTITKNTIGGDDTFNFGIFPTPSIITTTTANGTKSGSIALFPGNYAVSEIVPAGWTLKTSVCDNGTPGAITIAAGQTTTCTFTNEKGQAMPNPPPNLGSITIKKTTVGGDGTFNFSTDKKTIFPNFAITTNNGTGLYIQNNLPAGTYTITEVVPAGWTRTQDTCVIVILAAGQNLTCLITNTKNVAPLPVLPNPGFIKIIKNTTGGNGEFTFQSNFGITSLTTSNGVASQTSNPLPAGTYSISENTPPNWNLNSFTCDNGTPVAIKVEAGKTTTCTATNTLKQACNPLPTITSLSQDTAVVGDAPFEFSVNGTNFMQGSAIQFNGVAFQTIYVSQTLLKLNFPLTPTTPSIFNITVTNPVPCGGTSKNTKLLTIIEKNAAKGFIKITKNTIGGNGTFNFQNNFGITQLITSGSATEGTASQTSLPLNPGMYSISEVTPPTGWNLASFVCDNQNLPSQINLLAGKTVTCVATNVFGTPPGKGSIKIIKKAPGPDYQFDFSSNFGVTSLTTSNGTASQTVTNIIAGASYNISEINIPEGWSQESFICDNGTPNAIKVVANQTTTCTVTNKFNTDSVPKKLEIIEIIPTQKIVCDNNTIITLRGIGFVQNSIIYFDSLAVPTTYVSQDQLTTDVSQTPEGTYDIVVQNPDQTTSNYLQFTVSPETERENPQIVSLLPESVRPGSGAFTLTVNGNNFTPSSVIYFNDYAKTTTFLADGKLTARISASEVSRTGTFDVKIVNPSFGPQCRKQTSNIKRFPVTSNSNNTTSNSQENEPNLPFTLSPEP